MNPKSSERYIRIFFPVTLQDRAEFFTVNIQDGAESNVIASLPNGLQFPSLIMFVQFNLAMITIHFNYAKRRLDILKLLSMSDGRIGQLNKLNKGNSAW